MVEVYPRLWKGMGAEDGMTGDQRDACAVAEWMRLTDAEGGLPVYLEPRLSPEERAVAGVEGWILGVQ